jgi:hypothetical protein
MTDMKKLHDQQTVNKVNELQSSEYSIRDQSTTQGFKDLEKLADQKHKGIITEEEFIAKKKSILGILYKLQK